MVMNVEPSGNREEFSQPTKYILGSLAEWDRNTFTFLNIVIFIGPPRDIIVNLISKQTNILLHFAATIVSVDIL
jgi:hypothetical protein